MKYFEHATRKNVGKDPRRHGGVAPVLLAACLLQPAVAFASQSPVHQTRMGVPEELVEVYNQGVRALHAGQLYVAESAFLEVLKKGGPSSLVFTNLGTVYQQRGDHEKAIETLRRAVQLEPRSAPPRVLLGSSLLALGETAQATFQLEAAVRLSPKDPVAHLQLAKAYSRATNNLNAVDEFRAARALAPADPDLAYRLGNSYLKLSVWTLREVTRLNPKSPRADQMQAEIYRTQGRYDLALRFLQFAAAAGPKLSDIHLAMAEIYADQHKFREALEEVNQELGIIPHSARALELKGNLEAQAPQSSE